MQIVCHTSEEGRRDQRPAVEDILKCRHRSVTNIKWEVLRHFVLLQCHVFDYALILVSNLLRGTTFWSGQALVPSNKASTSGSGLASFESNQPWQRYATCKDMAGGSRKRQATQATSTKRIEPTLNQLHLPCEVSHCKARCHGGSQYSARSQFSRCICKRTIRECA